MALTKINPADQIPAASLTRAMMNTASSGSAVITKVIAGTNVSLSYTGADSGTGDVTISTTGAAAVSQTSISDVAYTMLGTDVSIQYTSLTANRTVTLVAASSFTAGKQITIGDLSGSIGSNKYIKIVPNGSDTILIGSSIGATSSLGLYTSYAQVVLESDGVSRWKVKSNTSGIGYGAPLTQFSSAGLVVTGTDGIPAGAWLSVQTLNAAPYAVGIDISGSVNSTGSGYATLNFNMAYSSGGYAALQSGCEIGQINFTGAALSGFYLTGAQIKSVAQENFGTGPSKSAANLVISTTDTTSESLTARLTIDSGGAINIGATSGSAASPGDMNISGSYKINGTNILQTYGSGSQTSNTSISNTTTPTTMGTTLASQTLAAGSSWRVRAYGTITSGNSGTSRNVLFRCYWGSTALTAFTFAVKTSTAATTNWDLEFEINASSTSAAWVTGKCYNNIVAGAVAAPLLSLLTPTSNTGLSTGAQTLDLRANFSTAVTSDAISVQNVTMERML